MPKNKSDQPKKKRDELRLLSKPVSFAADGNSLMLNTDNVGDLTFFQISRKEGNVVEANGVASVRLTINGLKVLRDMLINAINDHEKKMASKGQEIKDVT